MSNTIDCPKCGHEHHSEGNDSEYDGTDMECEGCGFEFTIEVEWDPNFHTTCKRHDYGDWEQRNHSGKIVVCRSCRCCLSLQLRSDPEVQQ